MKSQPNRDYNSNDVVMTPPYLAKRIVEHFKPSGHMLDPCRGSGSFHQFMPEPRPTLIRLVVIRPYTRRAIGLWAPIGSHTRSSKIMNHRLGRKRAWTFAHTVPALAQSGGEKTTTKESNA